VETNEPIRESVERRKLPSVMGSWTEPSDVFICIEIVSALTISMQIKTFDDS